MSLSYLDFIKRQSLDQKVNTRMDVDHFIMDNKVKTVFGYFPFAYYILDYRSQKFEVMNNSDQVTGYSRDDFLRGGLPASLRNLHPDDFKIFSNELFPEVLNFFAIVPASEYQNYRISYNYRYCRKDGSYIQMQQHSVFTDFNHYHLPARSFSIVSDITTCKRDPSLNLTITKLKEGNEEIELNKKFQIEKPDLLTSREKEILRLTMKGYTGKEIADKLFISLNTVRNHKSNMMEKTNTLNMASLIDHYMAVGNL
jgi:DNA-binding CsgD family transcriptional regulator